MLCFKPGHAYTTNQRQSVGIKKWESTSVQIHALPELRSLWHYFSKIDPIM